MTTTEARRLLSPEEIAVQAGQQVPHVLLPDARQLFAERETRLRQLAAGHPMRDFLLLAAELARGQHELLQRFPAVPLPDSAALEQAGLGGQAPLPAAAWPRAPAWRDGLAKLLQALPARLPGSPALAAVQRVAELPDDELEQQAGKLLTGTMRGLDLAAAPFIAAALQAYWVHLVTATEASQAGQAAAFGRTDDATRCPCCASLPTASVTRLGQQSGYRYLSCSLCSAQWHMVRIKCSHCQGTKGIAYQSLAAEAGHAERASAAAAGAVQAETCDSCGHYLKIVHQAKDPHVEPAADDLATLTLDLLVSEAGFQRHGVNLMLLFGEPPPDESPP